MKLAPFISLAFSASTIANNLSARGFLVGGGFGLRAGICPSGLDPYACRNTCCPPGFGPPSECSGGDKGTVCCPKGVTCAETLSATPFCADPSWVLWVTTATEGVHFCCLPGEIGTNSAQCVGGGSVVAATLAASSIGQPTPTGAAASTVSPQAPMTASGASSGTMTTTAGSNTSKSSAGSSVASESPAASRSATSKSDASIARPAGGYGGNIFGTCVTFGLMGVVFFAARQM